MILMISSPDIQKSIITVRNLGLRVDRVNQPADKLQNDVQLTLKTAEKVLFC